MKAHQAIDHIARRKLISSFKEKNSCQSGDYAAIGYEFNLPCGRLRIGRMVMQNGAKYPSIAYIGNRHTNSWTIRLWGIGASYLPNE